jgi:hypothetical protein
MASKEILVRQLAFVLLNEAGKLKRLLIVPNDKTLSLNDLMIRKADEMKNYLVNTVLVYLPFKQMQPEYLTKDSLE